MPPGLGVAAGAAAEDILDPLDRRQRRLPPRRVVGMGAGLVAEGRGLAEDPRHGGRAGLPLLEIIRGAQAADGRQGQHRGGQPDLELAPPPFLDGPRLGHGPLALGGAELLLHAGQVGRDPAGHRPRVARPVGRLGGEAVAGQRDEVGVGPAGGQPGAGVGRVAAQWPCGRPRCRSARCRPAGR